MGVFNQDTGPTAWGAVGGRTHVWASSEVPPWMHSLASVLFSPVSIIILGESKMALLTQIHLRLLGIIIFWHIFLFLRERSAFYRSKERNLQIHLQRQKSPALNCGVSAWRHLPPQPAGMGQCSLFGDGRVTRTCSSNPAVCKGWMLFWGLGNFKIMWLPSGFCLIR